MPEISVVILTRDRNDDLVEAIDSVLTQTGVSFEVVLVDNASSDGTSELVEHKYPQIRCIRVPYNLGVIGGRNLGMANARGEVLFLLDDDALLPRPDIMEKAYRHFQDDPDLGVLFGTIYNYFDGAIERPVGIQSPDYSWSRPYYTYQFRGVAHFIRRSLIEQIGYLEPLFFREGEERDFSLRVLRAGKRILYSPSVEVRHKINPHRYASGEVQSLKFLHELITLWTYYPAFDALLFSAWDIVSGFVYSVKGRWFIDYVRSLLLFMFWHLPFTIPKRRRPLPREVVHHIYALGASNISNPENLAEAQVSLASYCRNYLRHLKGKKKVKGQGL
jgi:hypothetical protein